jgi:uncharacterized damage-inducible protein DinB
MTLNELLLSRAKDTYQSTDDLLNLVQDADLDWKPEQGDNWWTVGQLLKHITVSCGIWCKGFVEGTWDDAGDIDESMVDEGVELPPAEAYRAVESVQSARDALATDRELALRMIQRTTDAELLEKNVSAPWNPTPRLLALRLLDMIRHLESHKAQLFYYLKLMGRPVHTGHLWGMGNVIED